MILTLTSIRLTFDFSSIVIVIIIIVIIALLVKAMEKYSRISEVRRMIKLKLCNRQERLSMVNETKNRFNLAVEGFRVKQQKNYFEKKGIILRGAKVEGALTLTVAEIQLKHVREIN